MKKKLHVYIVFEFGSKNSGVDPRIIKVCSNEAMALRIAKPYHCVLRFPVVGIKMLSHFKSFDVIRICEE